MPPRIAKLPRNERGYPVPYFVQYVEGKPDFRIMDGQKLIDALRYRLCWICGDSLGKQATFPVGPMCCVNRVSSEPPSHRQCAEYAVLVCPFLLLPKKERRDENLPAGIEVSGVMIPRNPGVICLWTTDEWSRFNVPTGGQLLRLGEPNHLSWWSEGRRATRIEVKESMDSGMKLLAEMATDDGERVQLLKGYKRAVQLMPD